MLVTELLYFIAATIISGVIGFLFLSVLSLILLLMFQDKFK